MTFFYFGLLAASGASTLAGVSLTSRSRNFAVAWALHTVATSLMVVAFIIDGAPLVGLLPAAAVLFCVRQWWRAFRRDRPNSESPPRWLRFILASLLIVAVISTATCALLLAMLASAHTPTVAATGLGVLFLAGAATYPAFAGLIRWSER